MVKLTNLNTSKEETALNAAKDQVDYQDQEEAQNMNQEGVDSQKDNDAVETLQELDKENH